MRRLFLMLTFCIATYLPPKKVKWMYKAGLKEVIEFVRNDALAEVEPEDGKVVICCYPGEKRWWECGFFAVKEGNGCWYFANDQSKEVTEEESKSSYKEYIKSKLPDFKLAQDKITDPEVKYSIIAKLNLMDQPVDIMLQLIPKNANNLTYFFGNGIKIDVIGSTNMNLVSEAGFQGNKRLKIAFYKFTLKLEGDKIITSPLQRIW